MQWPSAGASIRSERRFEFEATPDVLWQQLADVDRFRSYWPWLDELDADLLAPGEVWRCKVRPPVPYSVRFTLTIDEVAVRERISATVNGDIAGSAELRLSAIPAGTELHLRSLLWARRPALRALSLIGGPLVRFGHDWVLDTGARQFGRVDGRPSSSVRRR